MSHTLLMIKYGIFFLEINFRYFRLNLNQLWAYYKVLIKTTQKQKNFVGRKKKETFIHRDR